MLSAWGFCILCYGLNMLMLGLWSHPLLIAHHLYISWLNCRRILRAYLVLLFCTTKLMCEISCEKTGTLFRKSDYWFTNSIVILFFFCHLSILFSIYSHTYNATDLLQRGLEKIANGKPYTSKRCSTNDVIVINYTAIWSWSNVSCNYGGQWLWRQV